MTTPSSLILHSDRVRRSALWAAYGDALGFITELATPSILKKRCGATEVSSLLPWVRRIGGRFGEDISLPLGCYSDDTQLRLATSRAIRGNGEFDVEAFANVELPIWNAYALGGGTATKAAADELSQSGARWFSNFYTKTKSKYVNGGGNGAAMRVQPHVWSASVKGSPEDSLKDVIRNALVTHGHPRAIAGAVFHSLCLHCALFEGAVPGPNEWKEFAKVVNHIPKLMQSDHDLQTIWLPLWERENRRSLESAFEETESEMQQDIQIAARSLGRPSIDHNKDRYNRLVEELGAFKTDTIGSGIKTSILASFLAVAYGGDPCDSMVIAANTLGSDTDTIATMAGAIIGCVAKCDPPQDVMDKGYLEIEARRLAAISIGRSETAFRYPDLLYWKPPKRLLDMVGMKDSKWFVAGLGEAKPVGEPHEHKDRKVISEWFELYFGQHVLLRHRKNLESMPQESLPLFDDEHVERIMSTSKGMTPVSKEYVANAANGYRAKPASIDQAANDVIRSGFDAKIIGAWLVRFADEIEGVDKAIAFSAIVSKARNARTRKSNSEVP